jgi:LacI family transcriptional regulator
MTALMQDVAHRAGVSTTTVSHVLNNTRPVASKTRDRVLAAVRELGYHASAPARLLARGRSSTHGLLISDIENPFFPELIKSFELAALRKGGDILLGTTNYDPDQARKAVQRMIENGVRAAAVMTTQLDASLVEELRAQGIPVVLLDGPSSGPGLGIIRVDYSRGVGEAVRHLRALGHRDVAVLAGPAERLSAVRYRRACLGALKKEGFPEPRLLEGDNRVEGGAAAARTLQGKTPLPTALLCGNDLMAIGAIQAFHAAGLRCPQDVSVVGSDDILSAQYFNPPLTTVRVPRERLGTLAFEALGGMLREPTKAGPELSLETLLVTRQSTGPRARK